MYKDYIYLRRVIYKNKDYIFSYFLNFYRDFCQEKTIDEKNMNEFFTDYTITLEIKTNKG